MIHKANDSSRLHFIDNLRATTMLLVVVMHCLFSFTSADFYPWPLRDINADKKFDLIVIYIHGFTMPLFFFIAGLVASRIYTYGGDVIFLRNRLLRIGIPFLMGIFILTYVHAMQWLSYFASSYHNLGNVNGGITLSELIRQAKQVGNFGTFFDSTGSLWFLYYLLMFYGLTLIILLSKNKFSKINTLMKSPPLKKWGKGGFWLLIILTAMALYPLPNWRIEPPISFVPNMWCLIFYGLFYWIGWCISYKPEFFAILLRAKTIYMFLLLCLLVFLPGYTLVQYYHENLDIRFYNLIKILSLLAGAGSAWCILLGMYVFYWHHLNFKQKTLHYLAQSSYWVYLIQLPIIIYWQEYFSKSTFASPIKLLLLVAMVLCTSLLSYQLIVRHTFIGRVLGSNKSTPIQI